jgi:hypothetical protein
MEIQLKKLASNLDIQLMCLPDLLVSSRRRFTLWCLVSQSFFLTKDFCMDKSFFMQAFFICEYSYELDI